MTTQSATTGQPECVLQAARERIKIAANDAFFQELLRTGNATEAWLHSHPQCTSRPCAAQAASRYLSSPSVKRMLVETVDDIPLKWVLKHLIKHVESSPPSTSLRAVELLLKLKGELIERSHITTEPTYSEQELKFLSERPGKPSRRLGPHWRHRAPAS